jgi:hypothetical protein
VASHQGRWPRLEQFVSVARRLCPSAHPAFPVAGGITLTIGLCLLAACNLGRSRPTYPQAFQSEDPADRVWAAKTAAERHDRNALPLLVERLEDEDDAVRLFAIVALERLTGTRLGYQYYDPPAQRERAVRRWRHYLRQQPPRGATTRTAGPVAQGAASP